MTSNEQEGILSDALNQDEPHEISQPVVNSLKKDTCPWKVQWKQTSGIVRSFDDVMLCIVGRGRIRCIEGIIHVHGFPLSDDFIDFESPHWTSWVTISMMPSSTLEIMSSRVVDNQATFRVVDINETSCRPTIFPGSWKISVQNVVEDYGTHRLALEKQQHALHRDEFESSGNHKGFRCVFVGAKGVGKSTLLRYTIHSLLHNGPVAVIDGDTGQPEFSPPGLVTLTFVDTALLSPPHLHLASHDNESIRLITSRFFGYHTSQEDPPRYIQCISSLLDEYRSLLEDNPFLPLLINLDGWVKGLGLQVLQALLKDILHADHVLQIQGETKSSVFDLKDTVHEPAVLHVLESFVKVDKTVQCSVPSSALRALRIITYFIQDTAFWDRVSFGQTGLSDDTFQISSYFCRLIPYAVSLAQLRINFAGDNLARDIKSTTALCNALNGSIVALCGYHNSQNDNGEDPTLPPCFGLGIVRAIDRYKQILYILTPVQEQVLQLVQQLILGRIVLPRECVYRERFAEAFPCLSNVETRGSEALGANAMKSRNNITRKTLGA